MKQANLKSAWGICFLFLGIAAAAVMFMLDFFGLLPQKSYGAEYFGIETIKSPVDFNGNGTDDYTDILLGAKKDAENKPKYVDKYYKGGYPPENEGVCTDLIWARICLRRLFSARYAGLRHTPKSAGLPARFSQG